MNQHSIQSLRLSQKARSAFCKARIFGLLSAIGLLLQSALVGASQPLFDKENNFTEAFIEALLYPGEHLNKRFVYVSEGEEAQYCLDSSLGAKEPFAQVYLERVLWPTVGGVELEVEKLDLKLMPKGKEVTDEELDFGFAIRWHIEALGQDFSKAPVFKIRAVGAEIYSTKNDNVLMHWQKPMAPQICRESKDEFPKCDLPNISLASQAVAIGPLGNIAAIATTGLKPGIELYDIEEEPKRRWQILFAADSGGAIDVAFSSDGKYVVALLGNGEIHRFDAQSGGAHLGIPSSGVSAHAVPPGNLIAVGDRGGELVLWRLIDGTIEWKIEGKHFRGNIADISVSENGKIIATLEYTDKQTIVRIWQIYQKKALAQIELEGTGYVDMALAQEGDKLFLSHEEKGLMQIDLQANLTAHSVGNDASKCTSQLFWIANDNKLGCSVTGGIIHLNQDGTVHRNLKIKSEAKRWMVAQSLVGTTIAVGSGHLLLWRK